MNEDILSKLEIDITKECYYNCPGCNRLCDIKNKNPESVMNMNDIKDITCQIIDNNIKMKFITIIGGEPTLNKDFVDICIYIHEKIGCPVRIKTFNENISKYIEIFKPYPNIYFFDGASDKKTIELKNETHINMLLSPKEQGQKYHVPCKIPQVCGINVSKFKSKLHWYWCSCIIIPILLGKNTKSTLTELRKSNLKDDLRDVCCHCQFSVCNDKYIYIKDNKNVSECFQSGLTKYLRDM